MINMATEEIVDVPVVEEAVVEEAVPEPVEAPVVQEEPVPEPVVEVPVVQEEPAPAPAPPAVPKRTTGITGILGTIRSAGVKLSIQY